MNYKIAVLLPCYNEEKSISKVVSDFKKYLPQAIIYVYDNNSKDNTAQEALNAGAIVRKELYQGKGNVIRRMFADIDADIYIMSDGDETYDIKRSEDLINELVNNQLDMVIGSRKEVDLAAYRIGHRTGNFLLTRLVQTFFSYPLEDMLSGFRVFSKRFVKTFPAQSKGFEIETELTIFALSNRLPIKEVETDYFSRPVGSFSKLSTYKDGFRILKTILTLIKEERPLLFFNIIAGILFSLSLLSALPVLIEYFSIKTISHIPLTILATSLMLCSCISFLIGLVLDSTSNNRKEARRLAYLQQKIE